MTCVSPRLVWRGKTIDVKKNQWRPIAIALVILPILVFCIAKSFRIDLEEHQSYQKHFVHEFVHHENFSKNILTAKYNVFFSYDAINTSFALLKEDFTHLQSIPKFINRQGQAEMQELLDRQAQEITLKEEAIERFKTRNSAVKNSLRYLPELKAEIVARLSSASGETSLTSEDEVGRELIALIDPLLQDILQYNLTSERSLSLKISFTINQLKNFQEKHDLNRISSSLNLLLLHSQVVLDGQYELNRLSVTLMDNKILKKTEQLEKLYLLYYSKAAQEANLYRLVSFAILLAILIWISCLVIHRLLKVNRRITQMNTSLEETLQELKRTQAQLIQTEKMSSLGQMVAGIAHEINNPVSFIYSNIKPASQYIQDLIKIIRAYELEYPTPSEQIKDLSEEIELDFIQEDLVKILMSMKFGAERIQKIVLSLRSFSRLDESEIKKVDIHEGIDSALVILQNRMLDRVGNPKISVIKHYGDLPKVTCYASQLNQVFLNILDNAIDAFPARSSDDVKKVYPSTEFSSETVDNKIFITTEVAHPPLNSQPDCVIIRIRDNGVGIPKSIQSQIFDPFFTTKPVGKGTGLGLSIGYQIIVKKHNGTLKCFSNPERGTEFYIEIPVRQN